ncbi:hypothetical protein [Lederbergia citri]|uniref:Uncharacterized protein n=1 Tax=Lederbergia citri TaxID=2833580 RepID=A0A942TG71_9BACI|nr:hypothetical protein [Lederbergia citri]MBS4195789.1 hypothetical protein [Lederbergia citri]
MEDLTGKSRCSSQTGLRRESVKFFIELMVQFNKSGFYSYNFDKNKKSRYDMKLEKIKETIFVIGTYTFLLLFFYSFIDTNWSSEKLNYFKPFIGVWGLLVVVGYIERS